MNPISILISELSNTPFGFAILLTAYLLGAIPFGFVIAKFFLGYDIRNVGSGNIGMTNMIRTGGKTPGIATFLLDFGKRALAVTIAKLLHAPESIILTGGFLAVFGHTRSIFLKFTGGKGVAAYLGVLLAVDYRFFLVFALSWLGMFIIKKVSSLSALTALIILPVSGFFVRGISLSFYFYLLTSIYIIVLHHENIKRLLLGEEGKLKSSDQNK